MNSIRLYKIQIRIIILKIRVTELISNHLSILIFDKIKWLIRLS